MKTNRGIKKAVSLLLAVVMTVVLVCTAMGSISAAAASISYSFTYDTAGYAQGTITLTAPAGTYWLYWADETKALDGYYPIATLTLSSDGSKSHTMYAQTAIPADATRVIAIKSNAEPGTRLVNIASASYTVPVSKRLGRTSAQRQYRFMSYSDVHFDALYRTYKYDETHWSHALQAAADRDVDFMVGSGDYINNNIDYPEPWADEWARYQKILAESDYCNPIYEAIGNHELWHDVTQGTKDFIKATGLGDSVSSASNAYFEKDINGDHFIFMSMEGGFNPTEASEFSDAQLNWLENLLRQYSGDGKNIFIIEHSLFDGYGAGDRINPKPFYDIPLSDNYASTGRLKTILQTYKDSIFITGHTHIAFREQYNYSDNNGTSAQMIHNSSVGGVRKVVNGALDRNYLEDEAEGYIVDVFDNAILFNGANLYYNRIDPNWCYILRTSQQVKDGAAQTPTSAQTTTVQPATQFQGTATSYYLRGSFNSWGTSNPLYTTADGDVISTTLNLSAGTYTFKINNGSTWYGNGGTIEDTTKKTSNGGWVMGTSDGDCTLKATGGAYTFNFTLSTHKLNLLYASASTNAKSVGEVGASKTYYLFGYINGADYGCESDYQTMCIYKFTNGSLTATFTKDSYVAVKEENNANWYMTDGWRGNVTSVQLINTTKLGSDANKLFVPAGQVRFTLAENADGSLNLSYVTVVPTTAAPTTVKPSTAPPTTAAPTTAPVTYSLGDVNGDGYIDVCDATAIQRHLAGYELLSDAQLQAARVSGNAQLTIADVTELQKYVASLTTQFPAETAQPTTAAPTTVAPTTAAPTTVAPTTQGADVAQVNALMSSVSTTLSKYYRYSSYDCYQALKKEYRADRALVDAGSASQVNTTKLTGLHNALLGVVDASNVDTVQTSRTVYFENTNGWANVYAYVWGNNGYGEQKAWPGNKASYVGKNEYGKAIYSYTVTDLNYKNVIFNNGESTPSQTQDLRLYRDGLSFYISDSSNPAYCKGYLFKQSYIVG